MMCARDSLERLQRESGYYVLTMQDNGDRLHLVQARGPVNRKALADIRAQGLDLECSYRRITIRLALSALRYQDEFVITKQQFLYVDKLPHEELWKRKEKDSRDTLIGRYEWYLGHTYIAGYNLPHTCCIALPFLLIILHLQNDLPMISWETDIVQICASRHSQVRTWLQS